MERLRDFDRSLREELQKRFGAEIVPTLKFLIPNEFLEDMAFSKNSCYTQYALIASISNQGEPKETTCFKGLIHAQFTQDSEKLDCLEMWSNFDIPRRRDETSSSPSRLHINKTCSFPSIVSLDNPLFDHNEGGMEHLHVPLSRTNANSKTSERKSSIPTKKRKIEKDQIGFGIDLDSCSSNAKK